jgi:hypothetical protein
MSDLRKAGNAWSKLYAKAIEAARAEKKASALGSLEASVGLQAPAVVVPSGLNKLKEAVKNQSGSFGAKRVERAADEIKNLERLYTTDALKEAFIGDNARALMTMNPSDFERYATPIPKRMSGPQEFRGFGNQFHDESMKSMTLSDYLDNLANVKGGFADVPYLIINKEEQGLPLTPFISGHEGRHRNRALAKQGEEAGLVKLLPRSELREPFPRRDQEEYIEALRKELGMTDDLVLPQKYNEATESLFDKQIQRPAIKLPEIYADGGKVAKGVMGALARAREMAKAEKAAESLAEADPAVETLVKAAERAAAGRKAADVNKATSPMKMSEALGNMNLEGKGKLRVTQSDRTRVGGGNIGGAHFSGLQQVDPFYENAAWGVGKKGTASAMINLSDPNTLWSTVLGSADQLKSNPLVFNKLRKGFTEAMKEGKLSDELAAKINHNLALKFGEGADIRNPKIWQYADTFDKRALLADQMLGQGANPKEGGIPLGGEKSGRGVIFRPTDILKQETEPTLLHPEHGGTVPSFAVGPRLFSLSGDVKERPDLHPGFPFILQGEDKGVVFDPVEGQIAMPDFTKALKEKYGRGPGYFEWTMGKKDKATGETLTPVQAITEEYLTGLQKAGKKDGGSVDKPKKPHWYDDFHRKMAEGGVVFTDKDAVDNFLMVRHKAEGGDADDVSVKDIARNLGKLAKEQGKEELSSLKKPRAITDIGNRGILAPALGSPVDLINMGLGGIDALTAKSANPTRLASEKPIFGQEHIKDLMNEYGITSGEDRPMMETTLSFFSPTGMIKGAQKSGELAKKLPGFVRKIESGLASMSKKPQ